MTQPSVVLQRQITFSFALNVTLKTHSKSKFIISKGYEHSDFCAPVVR